MASAENLVGLVHADLAEDDDIVVSASVGTDTWTHRVLQSLEKDDDKMSHDKKGSDEISHDKKGSDETSHDKKESDEKEKCAERQIAVAAKVAECKKRFHLDRCLELKNLPENCTKEDIIGGLSDLDVLSVTMEEKQINSSPSALVNLRNPRELDDWSQIRENVVFIGSKRVIANLSFSHNWLCVSRMPLHMSEMCFIEMLKTLGKVETAFIMISETTGQSKGYGFVRYTSSAVSSQARFLLHNRVVKDHKLCCEPLDPSIRTFGDLHSKVLFVDNLPRDYRDLSEFRQLFSRLYKPPYCQIAMPKGRIQDWGLVEFFRAEHAERTQQALNGVSIRSKAIRVHHCCPGITAISIYMKAVQATETERSGALLNDAPSTQVYSQLQKLTQHNPDFASNMKSIIQDSIRNFSSEEPYQSTSALPTSMASPMSSLDPMQVWPHLTPSEVTWPRHQSDPCSGTFGLYDSRNLVSSLFTTPVLTTGTSLFMPTSNTLMLNAPNLYSNMVNPMFNAGLVTPNMAEYPMTNLDLNSYLPLATFVPNAAAVKRKSDEEEGLNKRRRF